MTSPAVIPATAIPAGTDPPQPRRFTFEEYCTYEDSTDNRYELVQGYLQLMSPPAGLHVAICDFLVHVFNRLFARTQRPLQASREFGVRIGDNTCRIVDVCVNAKDCWQKIAQPGEIGIFQQAQTPLLVVEVASTNTKEDYETKYREYASIGIPEYWIVNHRREHLRVCTLDPASATYRYREFGKGERIISKVLPQLELTVDEILNPPIFSDLIDLEQAERDTLAAENETVTAERDALAAENETVTAERDVFKAERDALAAEKAAMQQQLEQLRASIAEKGQN